MRKISKDSKWHIVKEIPELSGNYAIYFVENGSPKLFYIGTASNLRTRIIGHPTIKTMIRYFRYLGRDTTFLIKVKHYKYYNHRISTEVDLIKRLSPILN